MATEQPLSNLETIGNTAISSSRQSYTLEYMIGRWLHAKFERSKSGKTRKAYEETMSSFRNALHAFNTDLDGDPEKVGAIAQGWAPLRTEGARREGDVSPATRKLRLCIISSFYKYSRANRMFPGENPIEPILLDLPRIQDYAEAEALQPAEVSAILDKIERNTLKGKRDYALLTVALTTGRRVSEIAGMIWDHVKVKQTKQGQRVKVFFPHIKGGEKKSNELDANTSAALIDWLQAYYGAELDQIAKELPIWVSLSNNDTKGNQLSIEALEQICKRRCGSGRFHLLRHTFSIGMEAAGAPDSEIQAKLGHKSLATTGRYLAHFRSARNEYGAKLEATFGIKADDEESTA